MICWCVWKNNGTKHMGTKICYPRLWTKQNKQQQSLERKKIMHAISNTPNKNCNTAPRFSLHRTPNEREDSETYKRDCWNKYTPKRTLYKKYSPMKPLLETNSIVFPKNYRLFLKVKRGCNGFLFEYLKLFWFFALFFIQYWQFKFFIWKLIIE